MTGSWFVANMALSFVGSPAFVVAEKSGAAAPTGKRPSPPSGRFTGPLHARATATNAIHFMVISRTVPADARTQGAFRVSATDPERQRTSCLVDSALFF